MELMQVVIVSRHGIRTPYAPPYGTVTDFSAYTNKIFPDNNTWGMTYDAFATQQLTPHGEKVIPFMGAFYADRFVSDGLEVSCSEVTCFADDSGRDITTAHLWLQGFGCPNVDVQVVNATSNADMQPVLSDHFDVGCPLATEEQVDGLYGGDVDALTDMYDEGIQKVMDVLAMPPDASICEDANPDFDPAGNCTLFDTGSQWTGLYYEGMFTSPMYYAQYFAEAWMFQYTSNLTEWAFNLLTLDQLSDLYNMHIENLWFGTNYWYVVLISINALSLLCCYYFFFFHMMI